MWFGFAVVALLGFHLALNWRKMTKVVLGGRLWKSMTTIAVGIVMIFGLLFVPIHGGGKVTKGEQEHYEAAEHEEEDD